MIEVFLFSVAYLIQLLTMNNDSDNKYLREAIEEYERKIETGEDFYMDASVLMDIEAYYEKNNRDYDVERIMRFAERLHPDSEDVLIVKAYRLKAKGKWAEASNIIKRIPNQAHRDVQLFYAEADVASACTSRAIKRITNCLPAVLREEDYDWYLDLAEIMVDYGFVKRAAGLLLVIPKKYKFRRRVDELLTECYYTMQEFDKCLNICNDIVDESPYDAEAWVRLADIQQKCNKVEDSIISCDYALAIDEQNSRAMVLKIYAMSCVKTPEETLRLCMECIRLLPDNYEFHLRAGEQLFILKQPEKALRHFQESLKLCPVDSPDRARLIGNLAYLYVSMGLYTEAEDIMLSCLSGGSPFEPYVQLANLMFAFNVKEQAAFELSQAIACPNLSDKDFYAVAQILIENACYREAFHLWNTLAGCAEEKHYVDLHAYIAYAMYKMGEKDELTYQITFATSCAPELLMNLFSKEVKVNSLAELIAFLDLDI